jgi:hypothetical protein
MESLGISLNTHDRPRTANLPDAASSPVFIRRCGASTLAAMNAPQQLSRQAIDEFRAIYQDEFGVSLSDEEVQEIAMRLLGFFGILARPGGTSD